MKKIGKSVRRVLTAMKFCLFLLATNALQASTVVNAQNVKVDLTLENASLTQVFWELEKKTDIVFFFSVEDVAEVNGLNLNYKNEELEKVLKHLLKGTGLDYEITHEVVVIRKGEKPARTDTPQVRKKTVRGVVKDDNGETLPGATVVIKGTTIGVATAADGSFELTTEDKPGLTFIFSFMGMKNKEVVVGNRNELEITLETATNSLEEVIITGYQRISKERATGSFSVVTPKEIENKMETNIMSRLEGQVAGLVQYNNDVSIRGISTVYGTKTPLYVVDGVPYEGDMAALNPSDVQNVTVLKDATAASIYGARAANGVIVITTKSGQEGKTRVTYNGSVSFQPTPDLGYMKLMNSEQLINLKRDLFDDYHARYDQLNKRTSIDEVTELFYLQENGTITETELQQKLDVYRHRSNRSQIKDELLRTAMTHQHNVALSGGTEKFKYMASVNYLGNKPYEKSRNNDRLGFNLKNDIRFFSWLGASFGMAGSFTQDKGYNGLTGMSLLTSQPSYQMLKNEDGSSAAWRNGKSAYEIQHLTDLGLEDETYRPLDELKRQNYNNKSSYYKIQLGIDVKLMKGLDAHLLYQSENKDYRNVQTYAANSYYVRSMVNNAAQVNRDNGAITYNVPQGTQIYEIRGDMRSYTLRAQLNFDRTFKEKHSIVALVGTERRAIKKTTSAAYRMGFDENTLGYKPVDIKQLGIGINGTESLTGKYSWQDKNYNKFTETEDRYVAFYGNASYTYNDRYAVTGSIRVDQSNLFGQDPKYMWKPLWSVGGSWFASEEDFLKNVSWLNRLALRLTYGINGNVSKQTTPFMTIQDMGFSDWKQGFSSSVKTPPNPQLRWEKTAVTNVGIDFSVLKGRLSGSFDYYNRKSTDLLGDLKVDITTGWTSIKLNYGSLKNTGLELSLNSTNIQMKNFQWSTNLNFSYNKNKIIELTNKTQTAWNYVSENVNTVNHPMYGLYSYRWAGLNPENGDPLVYDAEGNKVSAINDKEALVYSGTTRPPYSASMTNILRYKGIGLSFMFIYNGGHVMRDAVATYLGATVGANIYRGSLNYWKKTGDESIKGIAPRANRLATKEKQQLWYAADTHILKADYIKLRDVTLSYELPKSLLGKLALQSVTVRAQARNIWWWAANDSGIDPESYTTSTYGRGARTLPEAPTYMVGLTVGF